MVRSAPSLTFGIGTAVVSFISTVVGVYLTALVTDYLAPNFGSQKNFGRAMQTVAYAYTPAWIGGILGIVPAIAWLGTLAGLYGLYLMYLGLPHTMKTPEDKTIVYMVVVIIILFVISMILAAILGGDPGRHPGHRRNGHDALVTAFPRFGYGNRALAALLPFLLVTPVFHTFCHENLHKVRGQRRYVPVRRAARPQRCPAHRSVWDGG